MFLSAKKFNQDYMNSIEGWLYEGALEITEILLSAQRSMAIQGSGVEIGVYKGKYLTFLAGASNFVWVGFDVFIFDQQKEAKKNIDNVLASSKSSTKVSLIHANTQAIDSSAFKKILAEQKITNISFASIDGDHSAQGVEHDLKIIEESLAPGGIVAIDDIFSPMSASVTEGFFRHMSAGSHLKPIAFSDNKLFMTSTGFDELYQIRIMMALSQSDGACGVRWKDGSMINRVRPFLGGRLINV
jgi:Methyltransferase domain